MKLLSVKSGQFLYNVNSTAFDRVAFDLALRIIDKNQKHYARYTPLFRRGAWAEAAIDKAIDKVSLNYQDFLDELVERVQPQIEYCKVVRGWMRGHYKHAPEAWTLKVSQPSTTGAGVYTSRINEIARGPDIYDKSLFKLQRRLVGLVRTPEMLRARLYDILIHDRGCDSLAERMGRIVFANPTTPWVLSHLTLTDAPIVRPASVVKLSSI